MLNRDDVQNGNVLTGPLGDRRVGGRIQSDAGQFVVLVDDAGHGTLIQDGILYDHEEYALHSRPAASGVAGAQDASEVEALRSELTRQSKLVDALLARDQAREAVVQADRPADPPVPAPEPASATTDPFIPTPTGDRGPDVPGPAAIPPPTGPQEA